jgi:hypothetical protein
MEFFKLKLHLEKLKLYMDSSNRRPLVLKRELQMTKFNTKDETYAPKRFLTTTRGNASCSSSSESLRDL